MRAQLSCFSVSSAHRIRLAWLCIALTSLLASGWMQSDARAAQVTLRWDYSASGAAGFVLYCGLSSRNYPTRIDVGNTDTYTISSLKEGSTSYCAVTAYDPAKVESGYSNEASFVVPYSALAVNFSATHQRPCASDRCIHQRDHRAGDKLGVELRRRHYQHSEKSDPHLQHPR